MTLIRRTSTILTTLCMLFSASEWMHAQPGRGGMMPQGEIAGSIVADESGESIPGAAVALWNADDSLLVTGAITKVDGSFAIEGLRAGRFYLKVSSLGYLIRVVPDVVLKPGAMSSDLGRILLTLDSTQTDETVVVSAERADMEFRSDRTIYNVENQPVTAGGTTIDVLKNVPQIEVDINDNVSLRGSQNVAIHINNRPVPLSGEALAGFLKGLPADMVKSVEVIPNPSAKYDPDGMAGIVNIVLKEAGKEGGTSGTVNLGVGTSNTYNASGSINVRRERFSLFSSYSFRYDERLSEGSSFRENRLLNPVSLLSQETEGNTISRSHTLNTTLDYNLDDKNTLTLSALGSATPNDGTNDIRYDEGRVGSELVQRTFRQSPSETTWWSTDLSLGYRWVKEASRHEFSTEARFSVNGGESDGSHTERLRNESQVIDSVMELQTTRTDVKDYTGSYQADYVRPLGEKGRLEAGYKWELTGINNSLYSETFDPQSGGFEPDIDLNNEFAYEQQLHSLYAILGREFGAFDAQVGVRAEQALTEFDLKTTGETFENDYFSLFPSAAISYSIGEATRLRASYSRRIVRPATWNLNPFPQYEDRLNLRRGNPYLDPEYTDAIELGLNRFMPWGSISFSPYYRYQTDQIGRWLEIDSNGVSTLTFENFKSSQTYGAEIVATYRIKDRLSAFANLSLYQNDLDGSNVEASLANDAFGWSARFNANWTIISGLDLQASYFYRGPIEIPGGEIGVFHSLDLAVKKSFLNDRASLTLRGSDVFNTMKFSFNRDDADYYVEGDYRWGSQRLSLNFAWNFGKQDRNAMRRRSQRDQSGQGPPGGLDF